MEINGKVDCARWGATPVLENLERFRRTDNWGPNGFKDGTGEYTYRSKDGRVIEYGKWENHQRIGTWILGGQKQYFIRGLQVPAALYDAPPEKLDPVKVMRIKNVDVRSIFIERVGLNRILKAFKSKPLHKDGDMVLYEMSFPKGTAGQYNILKVVCPSTKQKYFLRVPRDLTECEQARQWTFHRNGQEPFIQFDIET